MINLTFVTGAGLRRVVIDGRIVKFMASETGFQPIEFDLDNLSTKQSQKQMRKMKLSKEDKKGLKELSLLSDENSMAKDVIKDFKKTGWRLSQQKVTP